MQKLEEFESYAKHRFAEFSAPQTLLDAISYSLFSSGKRIRPLMMFAIAAMKKSNYQQLFPLALALEMVHTYSLIHDDLPAMDNDVLRRGKPTNHIAFGEAVALLAGDALLSQSFEILTEVETTAEKKVWLIKQFSQAIGISGMVAGQVRDMDLSNKEKSQTSLNELKEIHYQKTGKLFEFAILAAAYLYDYSLPVYTILESFAQNIGILYQAMDDYLDVLEDSETGKTQGIDQINGKITYLSFFSEDQLISYITNLADECKKMLAMLEIEGYDTSELATILALILRK